MSVSHRPTPLASGLAVLLGAASTAILAPTLDQRVAVVTAVVGVGLVVARGRESGLPVPEGRLWTVLGAALVLASLLRAETLADPRHRIELVPGLVGTALLGLGLRPVSERFARRFVSAGLAAFVVGVALVGVFEAAGPLRLLGATAAAIAAWDVAEHGISLGEQLRTDADTRAVELLHGGATTAVGVATVVVAMLFYRHGATGLPLGTLALLLAAAVTLMAALYR
ncbi:hypothetical protein NDI56_10185 [Haloarcula sp. S1CR25-12]|uniref:DUF92 domain-containing protein n=1 Tax=Haloarcula saliterrae TaxID=2950534 RepID=A0ABU2FCV0_9EURY|nr:hypothetical protein [Haloarcula sp. S1CR25-12]MDS0259758.1 hypothetical protein [Haloarcula sp. S1CR25-12]